MGEKARGKARSNEQTVHCIKSDRDAGRTAVREKKAIYMQSFAWYSNRTSNTYLFKPFSSMA